MKKLDQINSHIYVPKSILNRFATIDEKNRNILQYIDFRDMQIKKQQHQVLIPNKGIIVNKTKKF